MKSERGASQFLFMMILMGIVVGAAIILTGIATSALTSDSPAKQAREEATAAVIYQMMTPSLVPMPTMNGTPTPGMAQIALTVAMQEQAAMIERGRTQDANQLALERIKQEAEIEKARLQQEVDLAKISAGQTSEAMGYTATSEYRMIMDAHTAAAAATHAPETAAARTQTATAQYFADQLTVTALPVVMTVDYGNAVKVANAAKADSASVYTDAFAPTVVIFLLAAAAVFALFKWLELRTISRDEAQRNKTITIHHKNGTTVANQDRIPGGLFSVSKDGSVIIHQADQAEQSRTTERDQWVDGLQNLPPGRDKDATSIMNRILGRSGQAPERLNIREDGAMQTSIKEADGLLMEDGEA